jgi:hypothetical protein
MGESGLALLWRQHHELEAWFAELAPLRRPAAWYTWPHQPVDRRGNSDSGEEIREDLAHGLHRPSPAEMLHNISPMRAATPLPSEPYGAGDDAVPGQAWRDVAGHLADGKTHVGMETARFEAQMLQPSGAVRAESMVGQAREGRAGSGEQFPHPSMRLRGGVAAPVLNVRVASEHGLDELELDHKRTLVVRVCDLLTHHTLLEEAVLYPLARKLASEQRTPSADSTAAWVACGLAAHRDLLALVTELRRCDVGLPHADHLLAHLQAAWSAHAAEEEQRLFPVLEAWLGPEAVAALGQQLVHEARVPARHGELPLAGV